MESYGHGGLRWLGSRVGLEPFQEVPTHGYGRMCATAHGGLKPLPPARSKANQSRRTDQPNWRKGNDSFSPVGDSTLVHPSIYSREPFY